MCWAVERGPLTPHASAGLCGLEGDSRHGVSPGPFPEPTPAGCDVESTSPPCDHWANVFPEKGHQESHVGGNPLKTLASRMKSWTLGANAFYRSNKLHTTWLLRFCQVSWSPALLTLLEEEAEREANLGLGTCPRSLSQIGTESR